MTPAVLARSASPRLVCAFEACTLPKREWTHRAHLEVALWYRSRLGETEALDAMRRGILRYNEACGVVTTTTSGYHETITRFYIRVVQHFLEQDHGRGDWWERVDRLVERFGDRELPLRHYTRTLLMSPAARATWVEPDLVPLP